MYNRLQKHLKNKSFLYHKQLEFLTRRFIDQAIAHLVDQI